MAEVRTSAYNHVVQTPRIGGCTGAFFNLFDWNSKRFASTKRLPAERPEKTLRRSKSFRDGESRERGSAKAALEEEVSSKAPGLVARLMGLESLPEVTSASSKHRRARSCSGSESAGDSRGEKLALRDLLKQEHESLENFCSGGELALVPVPEQRVRKVAAQTPIKTLVPYVDSPAGSCRTVYALPWKGEKSPFLARLHPSPVLQPSKCHNQLVSPAQTSPGVKKKRASRFLEAAGKILEEISDNELSFPREREFAASSPPSSGTDLLHCRSMSRIWNGSEDTDSGRSAVARSFRGPQRRDRICRDIFETSLSERAPSVSPRPRRSSPRNPKEVNARPILRTQEAAVGEFKTDVRRASDSMPTFADSVRFMRRTTAAPAARRSLVPEVDIPFSSDDESLTDHLVRLATTVAAPVTPAQSKFQRKVSSSVGDFRVKRESSSAPSRVRSSSVSLHDGIRLPRSRENALTEFAKPRSGSGSASSPSHSRQFSSHIDELKLSVRVKRDKQVRESPAVQCHSPVSNTSPLKRPRRKNRHGSPRLRESSSQSRGGERRTPPLPKHRNVEAKSPARISTRTLKASSPGKRSAKQAPVQTLDDVVPDAAVPDEVELEFPDDAISLHVESAQGPARDLFPEVVVSSNPDELLVLGMDDLHWDHGMVEQQRENSSRSRYCEIRASGESLQSICDTALDEDVCNVDDGTLPSPSPQKFAGECSEADAHDESSTPLLMKRFLGKPLGLDVDMGETSPVSVLDSPFGDEVCTTSESSIAESERQQAVDQQPDSASESNIADQQAVDQQTDSAVSLTEIVADCDLSTELEVVSTPPSEPTPGDRVRQAILDISSFRSHDRAPTQASPQTEKTFVRQVLSAAQLLSSPGRSPNWYERDLAVDPSLFERLEGGDATSAEDGDFLCESGGMWRCDRKLLFDCVNEAFSQNICLFKDPQPWLPRRPVLRTRPQRQKLVDEVQEKINGWRQLASHAIDTLIDIDMSTRVGKWTDFSEEVAEVGAEIECMVWQVMVEELVLELLHR